MNDKKNILVTGGAGFIGSHLCERLARNTQNNVFSLDNYFTGSTDNHFANVTYINGNTTEITSHIHFTPDIIYHLGEYSRVEQSFQDIDLVWKYNKDSMFAVLEFVRKTGAKIIYAGSSTKFGDGGLGRSQSPYAWAKASNTELLLNYSQWFCIPYAIVYFYNVYGKREISTGKYATLIAHFAECMRLNKPLTIVSPGTQKRNFTHVDDIVEGIICVGEKAFGDNFGIGCRTAYSVNDIAEMFGGTVEMLPERSGNRMTSDLMIDKVEALGWSVKHNISDYIEQLRKNNWVLT